MKRYRSDMFTYIDPSVRQRLIETGKLIRMSAAGEPLDAHAPPPEGVRALNLLGPIPLPMQLPGVETVAQWYACARHTELANVQEMASDLRERGAQNLFASYASFVAVNSVLVVGRFDPDAEPLVRVHSNCLTGDVFGSQRCDCGPQLAAAVASMDAHPSGGLLIYMTGHEGRGIGLWAKAATYLLQDAGEDTYQANRSLGLPDDSRDFSDAATLLTWFMKGRRFRLLTNNPKKVNDLEAMGVRNIVQQRHMVGVTEWNQRYLSAKRDRGHDIDASDLEH